MSAARSPRRTISGRAFLAILGGAIGALILLQQLQTRGGRDGAFPVISEIQTANAGGLRDEDGESSDWIELWNPSTQVLDLGQWALTDDFRDLHKWRLPPVELGPREFLVVFASGRNRTNPAATLHTNFRLDPAGEYLAVVAAGSDRVVQEFLPRYPRQLADASFGLIPETFEQTNGRVRITPRDLAFFLRPSPGAPNADELLGLANAPRLSSPRGLRTNSFSLGITTDTFDAQIRYTLDGSIPSLVRGGAFARPLEIAATTVVRAAAFRPGYRPSDVDTHTYIFPERVLRQSGAGFPVTWGVRNGGDVIADYEVDPEIVGVAAGARRFLEGLRALPTVSLVLPPEDLFAPATGLYAHPLEQGPAWERRGSFEWLLPDGRSEAQVDCGVRIQGGWSRRPEESPKHSFRLVFRAEYGDAAFKHRLFDGPGPNTQHQLILRAGSNNSWLHWNGGERRRGDLLRDQWMRDTLRDLQQPAARGAFVHLYLNGLYWGLYNLVERPDAKFLAERFGGGAADYDARNGENVLSGETVVWDQLFALANAGLATPEAYSAIGRLLDVPAFIDFMLVHLYGGSADIDAASNWYAARPRRPDGRYVFLMWDGERSLEEINANALGLDADRSPTRLFQKLRENAAFRRAFAQRVKQLAAQGGVLSPEACARRYRRLADQVRPAMICESARWGDYRRDVHPYRDGPYELYTVEQHWEPEVRRLLEDYFPKRTPTFLTQLRAAGLADE